MFIRLADEARQAEERRAAEEADAARWENIFLYSWRRDIYDFLYRAAEAARIAEEEAAKAAEEAKRLAEEAAAK